jgi:hypothetical protein
MALLRTYPQFLVAQLLAFFDPVFSVTPLLLKMPNLQFGCSRSGAALGRKRFPLHDIATPER